jgi:cellulose biosynthesis protein BcsQ
MANIKIILADTDERYLMPLERKFIDELEDRVDLIVITDRDYLKQYFETPQKLDILIINEELYSAELEKHNIANIFILKEEETEDSNSGDLDTNEIYKYTSVKEIYNEVINRSSSRTVPLNNTEDTKVLMLYSPIGGIGKTSVAAALCEAFAKYHKKVLFIGIDSLQTFGSVIENLKAMENGAEKLMIQKNEYIYEVLKSKIITRTFDIVPPFYLSLPSLTIKGEDYINLMNCIKASKEYDYIIVDGASDFTEDISRLMAFANHTIIIAGQDINSAYKLDCLLRNIDCSDTERFVFICNKYRSEKEDYLNNEHFMNICTMTEYIEYLPEGGEPERNRFLNNRSVQKLALRFI